MQAAVAWMLPAILGNRGTRLGFLGDIFWLHKRGLLDVLALCSTVYADSLTRHGIRSIVVHRGFHPAYGSRLQLERDITVVWLGKMRTRRRHEVACGLARQLERRGQKVLIFDGKSNDFVFGEQRTKILNRAWFVLNVYFSSPSDELSLRQIVAAANDAVVMTEPKFQPVSVRSRAASCGVPAGRDGRQGDVLPESSRRVVLDRREHAPPDGRRAHPRTVAGANPRAGRDGIATLISCPSGRVCLK